MPDDYLSELPSYLHPLLEPTSGGSARLLAAWDGLNVETQIQILTWIERHESKVYSALAVRQQAIDSPNAYVRYLAAKHLHWNEEIRPRIARDEDFLVRCTALSVRIDKPEEFFELPQDTRLAYVRHRVLGGQSFASFIEYAIDHKSENAVASEGELAEIIIEHIRRPVFREKYYTDPHRPSFDYYVGKEKEDDLNSLWGLLPKLPDYLAIRTEPQFGRSRGQFPEPGSVPTFEHLCYPSSYG